MFAIVMCLSWYMVTFPPPIDQRSLSELIDDVTWVFRCLNTPKENTEMPGLSSRRQSRSSSKRTAPEPLVQKAPKRTSC